MYIKFRNSIEKIVLLVVEYKVQEGVNGKKV